MYCEVSEWASIQTKTKKKNEMVHWNEKKNLRKEQKKAFRKYTHTHTRKKEINKESEMIERHKRETRKSIPIKPTAQTQNSTEKRSDLFHIR